jgi:glucose-1-phosphate adenylyltransferase
MGADYFELAPVSPSGGGHDRHADSGLPAIGIGRNCVIDRAIIDKNARIADGVVITPEGSLLILTEKITSSAMASW